MSDEHHDAHSAADSPTGADPEAGPDQAKAALARYWAAWDSANFDEFLATTTGPMRASLGLSAQADFAEAAADWAEAAADTHRAVIEASLSESDETVAFVISEESSREGSEYVTEHLRHTLVLDGGHWLVDDESVIA